MKRLFFVIAAMASLINGLQKASAQSIEFTVAPRVEGMYDEAADDFGWGASALYTFLDGEIGEHWSFSISNHWLSPEPKYLYKDFKYAEEVDFLDWASLTYAAGNWEITFGKDGFTLDSFEIQPDDVDSYESSLGWMWNNLSAYQWGASVTYNFDDNNNVELRGCSSPFSLYYFDEQMFSFYWRGNPIDKYSTIWGLAYDTNNLQFLNLSNRYGDDTLYGTFEFYTQLHDFDAVYNEEAVSVSWLPSEKVRLTGRVGKYTFTGVDDNGYYGGAVFEYKPFGGSDSLFSDLRFHLNASYNDLFGGFVGVFGVTCPLTWSR